MRTRFKKNHAGCAYLLAASMRETLWLNPDKTSARRKTLASLWTA